MQCRWVSMAAGCLQGLASGYKNFFLYQTVSILYRNETVFLSLSTTKPNDMKKITLACILLLAITGLYAQTTAAYTQILTRYEQWKAAQYKAGNYATPANCKMEVVIKESYKGPQAGIPNDISVHYSDINGDNKMDALITFNPIQCDGGNAGMNIQSRVLILSKGAVWITDDKYIDNIEAKIDKGWMSVSGVTGGTIFGTYYEYKEDDGRCCPSIKKQFSIDFKTKKLEFE